MSLPIEALKEPTSWDYVHPKESHFSAEDVEKITAIEKISQTTLGLRHISSRERAIEESTRGIWGGCSLNISYGESLQVFDYTSMTIKPFDFPFKDFNEKIQRADMPLRVKLLDDYEKAIDKFIRTSIQTDLGGSLTLDSKVQDQLATAEKTSFVLLKYRIGSEPSDTKFPIYGGLGRFPKGDKPPKDVVLLPFVDINVPESERQKKIGSYGNCINIENFLVATYRTILIDYLRDKDLTFWKRDLT
jgi:hypothetical protein